MRRRYAVCGALLLAAAAGTSMAGSASTAIAPTAEGGEDGEATAAAIVLGTRREPFLDEFLVERLSGGARLRLHAPTPREVAVDHDAPWEGNVSTYHTLFRDGDRFRMYYRGAHYDEATRKPTHAEVVCYAESADGVHWTKPDLGLYEFEGSRKNNIVWMGTGGSGHNFAPFKDTRPDCRPDERYKAVASGKLDKKPVLFAYASPDGIRWKRLGDAPVLTQGVFDSLNVAFYDAARGRYVAFFRDFRGGVRQIVTATSSDFRTWTTPAFLRYDPGTPIEHLYTNAVVADPRAPHVFVGFPKRFVPGRNPTAHPEDGVSDGVFMSSRDGQTFHRWTEAFLRPGPQPSHWVNRNNLIAWGLAQTHAELPGAPDEISLYATEDYYRGRSCKLRRYTVRLDGFVSLNAPLSGGEVVTRPFTFAGDELSLNVATSAAGGVRVEVQDAGGKPIPGFGLEETPEVFGDSVEHVVRWKPGSRLAALAGRPIRLRFVLRDADLYSMQFRESSVRRAAADARL